MVNFFAKYSKCCPLDSWVPPHPHCEGCNTAAVVTSLVMCLRSWHKFSQDYRLAAICNGHLLMLANDSRQRTDNERQVTYSTQQIKKRVQYLSILNGFSNRPIQAKTLYLPSRISLKAILYPGVNWLVWSTERGLRFFSIKENVKVLPYDVECLRCKNVISEHTSNGKD